MANVKIEDIRRKIYSAADRGLYVYCFDLMRALAQQSKMWWANDEIDELWTRCRQMLIFNMGDVIDEGRTEFMQNIRCEIYSLTDRLVDSVGLTSSPAYDYVAMRDYNKRLATTIPDGSILLCARDDTMPYTAEQEYTLDVVFRYVWLCDAVSKEVENRWREWLMNDKYEAIFRIVVTSALTLRLLRVYDMRCMLLLLDVATHSDGKLRARAMVSVILVSMMYGKRLSLDKRVVEQLKHFFNDEELVPYIELSINRLMRTFKTDEVVRKMHEEIYPELMRSGAKIQQMMKDKSADNSIDEDGNPMWMSALENDAVQDKLREFGDMQLSGDDVYMSTFSNMKIFPFFSEIAHWFLPFDVRREDVHNLLGDTKDLLAVFAANPSMCNSDKYSFFYTLNQMPLDNVKQMISQMGGDDLQEQVKSEEWQSKLSKSQTEVEIGNYVQDLYRFYRLFRNKNDFSNPFCALTMAEPKVMPLSVMPLTMVRKICVSLFEVSMWEASVSLFSFLDNESVWDATFYQQYGYCQEKLEHWTEALEAYEKADLVQADDEWTIRHRALCYRKLQKYNEAVECYQSLSKIKPDDVTAIINQANCYVSLLQYDKALTLYYKADYLQPNQRRVQRLLAWVLFLAKRYEEALDKYAMLVASNDDTLEDYLNTGHVYMALHNKTEARKNYHDAMILAGGKERFIEVFMADADYLTALGLTAEDVVVLLNQVLMDDVV